MLSTERIAEIDKLLAGYEAWRERWYNVSGCKAALRPGEVALRELLAEVKATSSVRANCPSGCSKCPIEPNAAPAAAATEGRREGEDA